MNKWNYSKENSPKLSSCYKQLPFEEANSWHVMHYFPGNIERLLYKINLLFEHIHISKHNHGNYSIGQKEHVVENIIHEVCSFSKKDVHS